MENILFICLIILLILLFIVLIVVEIKRKANFKAELEQKIDNEINNFLIEKHDPNYKFKNEMIEEELRNRLKAAMIDLRTRYKFKPSYINRTTNKDKEIYAIINKFYLKDKEASS